LGQVGGGAGGASGGAVVPPSAGGSGPRNGSIVGFVQGVQVGSRFVDGLLHHLGKGGIRLFVPRATGRGRGGALGNRGGRQHSRRAAGGLQPFAHALKQPEVEQALALLAVQVGPR